MISWSTSRWTTPTTRDPTGVCEPGTTSFTTRSTEWWAPAAKDRQARKEPADTTGSGHLLRVSPLEPFLYPHYRFWIETGRRQGELLGRKWEHLNSDRYHVQEQLLRGGTFYGPKDES